MGKFDYKFDYKFDDLPTSIPVINFEGKFLCALEPGDVWRVYEPTGAVIIVNPDKRPRIVKMVDGEPVTTEL